MASTQKGFSAAEGLVIGVVIAIAGSLGFVAWNSFMQPSEVASTTKTSEQQSATAEVITTQADLDKVEKELDALNFDDEDAAQAEAQAEL